MRTTRTRRAGAYRRAWTAGRVALVLTLFAAVLVVMPPVANAATGDLVMVTGSGGLGGGDDTSKHAYLQSLGWTVTVMDDSSSAGVYSAAASANDVMFVSDTVADAAVVEASLPGLDIGMVIETYGPKFAVLYSPANDEGFVGDTQVDIVDGSHYITRTLGAGTRTIYSTSTDLNYWDAAANPLPAGVDVLAERVPNASHEALYVAETGADLYGANTAPNRRVFLPSDSAGYANWTTDYRTIVERSLDWAAGVVVTVNSTNDVSDSVAGDGVCDTGGTIGTDPECTLRAAIEEVNAGGAVDRIEFDIPAALVGGAHTITVTGTRLPAITRRVAIDATTEPDATSGPVVVLDGAGVSGPGLELGTGSDGSLIRGLAIHSFPGSGIVIGTDSNVVAGNRIGTDHLGSAGLGNASSGVYVWNGANNRIGGVGADGNIITGNADGVVLDAGADSGNAILGNSIWANDSFGIDLLNDGATDNDVLDADGGPNDRLNFPTLTPPAGGDTSLRIELDVPAGDYRIEVFGNPTEGGDISGRGEGEVFLHADTVTHTGSGSEAFTLPGVPALAEADVVSLTATEDLGGGIYGSTSEFSVATTVGPAPDPVVLDTVQSGTTTLPSGSSSVTVTIDAVDPGRSFLTFGIRSNDGNPTHILVRGQLTNATTLTFQRWGTTDDVQIEWSVTEFVSGVTVQRGTTQLNASPTEDVAISAVDLSRSFPMVGMSVNGTVYGDNDNIRAELTSTTNLRLTTRGATNQNFVDWQVVTYNDSAVQSGTLSLGTADASATATVTAVDTTKAWLVYSADGDNGTASDIGQKLIRGQVTDATTVTFDRSNTGQAMEISWHLIEFTDATTVQHASANVPTSTTVVDVPINAVGAGRAIAVGGDRGFGGRTSYSVDDNPGVGWFTTELTSSTNLRIERAVASAPADLGWFVIHWPCDDSDGDGLTDCEEDANTDGDNDPATNPGPDTDGDTLPNYLDADDDGDGLPTASENADPNADGDPRDALDSDRDGQPDYLDVEAGPSSTPIVDEQKISSIQGGLTGPLVDGGRFGSGVAAIGDLDGDGIVDLAAGAADALYVLFMNADGTVRADQRIADGSGGLVGSAVDFNGVVGSLGDIDGDGVVDVAVGMPTNDDGGSNRGAVLVLFLNADGTVKAEQKISDLEGGLSALLDDSDFFGASVAGIGDLDGDGVGDLIVGATGDDDGGSLRGAVYVLFLNADGTVKAEQKISDLAGGLAAVLDDFDIFGSSVAALGDVDGDGVVDIGVGSYQDQTGGVFNSGSAYVLFLNIDGTVKAEQKLSNDEGGLAPNDLDDYFGVSIAGLGDLDGDGVVDVAVGSERGGIDSRGRLHLLLLNADGTVKAQHRIDAGDGGLSGPLDVGDIFSWSVASLGDLDGDGALNLAVGVYGDDDGGSNRGAVYILDLTALVDSDGDGLWDHEEDANLDADNDPATSSGPDTDGDTLPNYLDADDDGDGTPTASENADPNADGDPRDALDVDRDGEPDYLDAPTAPTSPLVAEEQKISSTEGSLTGPLVDFDAFGTAVSAIGDLDGDGIVDVVVGADFDDDGASASGAVYILFMNANGTVKAEQKISALSGGLTGPIGGGDSFGSAVAGIGDLDGDGTPDIAVGARADDDGVSNAGAVYILFMNTDGTVRDEQKISATVGGFNATLESLDFFGSSLAGAGDLDGDGLGDLIVGAQLDDGAGSNRGAVYVLFLRADGTVRAEQEISRGQGGLAALIDDSDTFGSGVGRIGDVDGDGVEDIVVGARGDDDGGSGRGAVYVLFLNPDGTVKAEQKISELEGGLATVLDDGDAFGTDVAGIGDLNRDGVADILVGANGDDDGGSDSGAVYVLLLNADGTVMAEQKISDSEGGFETPLSLFDEFGSAVGGLGDLDDDGTIDVVVGATSDDDGGAGRGAIYRIDLSPPSLVVNATGDASDLTPGDGLCDTGVDLAGPADECTLRAAIEEANASGSADIAFAIPTSDAGYDPSGFWRIAPAMQLPRVTATVTIDGTTQPGYGGTPIIEIADPASVSTGLEVDGASSVVRGLSIVGFQNGVRVGGSNSIVQGNWIGTRPDGTEFGNFYGVVVDGGSGALIGGSGFGEGNVIARAFTSGIRLASGASVVQGNSIGRRPDGVVTLMDTGIEVDSSGNLIGGTAPGEGNEITGSTETAASRGVRVDAGTGTSIIGNTIFGNVQNIDLGADGPTVNDPLDTDSGANSLLNTPELAITATTPLGGGTSSVDLDVTLDVPAGNYRIEVFDGSASGFGGEGQAEALVHAFSISHPGGGAQVFTTTYSGPDPVALSATTTQDLGASDYGSTSELSTATGALTGTVVVNSTADTGDGNLGDGVCDTLGTNSEGASECTLRAAIQEANRGIGVTILFDLPATEPGHLVADEYWLIDMGGIMFEDLLGFGMTIDGSSQPGYDGTGPVVHVRSAGGDTLDIVADDITVQDLSIGSPGDDAIQIRGDRVVLDRMWLGLDPTGAADGSPSTGNEGIIVYDGSVDTRVTNSRISDFDSGVVSNSGTIDITVEDTEIFSNRNGGVVFNNAGRVTLLRNSIHDNTGLGFELGVVSDGVPLPNDVGDGDSGGNDLLNHPVLTNTTIGAGTVDIDYTIDVPAGTYRVEFFDSERPDPTGFGEGQTFLSAETIVHPGGSASYTATVVGGPGDVFTATATPDLGGGSFGGTSEFSNTALVGIVFVNATGDGGDLATGDGVCDTGGTNTDGFVECTLRAAIQEANASADVDIIHFQIPETDPGFVAGSPGRWTIAPATTLGLTSDVSSLDATTQPGWADQPIIELDGSSVVAGIDRNGILLSDGMTLRGMSITNWLDFGVATDSAGATLSANWFGVAPDGSVAANGGDALAYGPTSGLVVGGPALTDGNLFAAGGGNDGLLIVDNSSNVLVENNRFGVTADGLSALGSTAAEHVVIANDAVGIVIRNNQFGDSPNAAVVVIDNASEIDIVGNVFGTDATGTASLPNGQALYAATSGQVRFGGTGAGDGNVVRNMVFDALLVDTGQTGPLSVLGNSIDGSGELGIELIPGDATANDPNDADTGPNGLLNFPEIVSATTSGGTTEILFTLDVPAGNYRIEAFANPSGANPSGFGEGEVFRGATTITHAGGGSQSFAMIVSGDTANLSMTTTEDLGGGTFGATSEFSQVATPVAAATVEDLSVRRNDLAAAGGNDPSVPAGGIAANGLGFDGGAERLVGPANEVDGSAFTMSAWVQLGTFGSQPRMLSKGSGVGAVYEMLVDDASGEAVARLEVGGVVREVRGGSLSIGTMHHVATTWDGSTVALYVDGQLVDTVAASGALGADLAEPLVIGNTSTGTAGLDGVIDQIEIHGRAMPGAEVLARFRNGSTPTLVQLGGEQTDAAGDWTTSATQARSGGNSLAAPETTPGADAWTTAIGVDEPGVELTAWWWVSDAAANEVAVGSRTGTTPTDQFDAAASGTGLDLGVLDGAVRTSADTDPTTLTPGVWQRVVFATDELGATTFSLDGITLLGPSTLAGLTSGSVGFRAADIDPGQQWFIDDVQLRRLVSDEPTTSFGPIERN